MRWIVFLYLLIGILLLVLGFFGTGDCQKKNMDPTNDIVFVLTWPVSFYGHVVSGPMTPTGWAHAQACEGGLDTQKATPPQKD